MQHKTHTKGDIAVTCVIADLTKRGWVPFRPVSAEFLPFDLLAVREEGGVRAIRTFQVKHRSLIEKRSKYAPGEFDYFALYLADVDKVAYVPMSMVKTSSGSIGVCISTKLPNANNSFWWYKDFLKLSKKLRTKRTIAEFGKNMTRPKTDKRKADLLKSRKLKVSDRSLSRLVWKHTLTELAAKFKVSTTSIRKRLHSSNIEYPEHGYWLRKI